MEIRKFAEEVKAVLGERTAKEVRIQKVTKNNGIELYGMSVVEPQINVTPTIYLEPYFEHYKGGVTVEDMVECIYRSYMKDKVDKPLDMSWFRDFEQVRGKVAFKLINYEKNKELLKHIPYTKVLDLAKVYYVTVETAELGSGTILIYNSHLTMWNITTEQLEEIAAENAPKLYPAVVDTMSNIVMEMLDMGEVECGAFPEMYVMTNSAGVFGAATMCYGDAIKKFAQNVDSDIIILPCSLHELILLPLKANSNLEMFKSMVCEVNRTEVASEDVLSDSVYIYRRKDNYIEII